MPVARLLRPNYLVVLMVVAGFLLLGVDRIVLIAPLRALANLLYSWTVLLAAVALLLGILNVTGVHLQRILAGSAGWQQSVALVVALAVVLITGLFSPAGVRSPLVEFLFDLIIAPGQATLFALLAFFMAAAAYRYLRIGRPGGAWVLVGVLLVMAVQMPIANTLLPQALGALIDWLLVVPVMAALRGAILGSSFALILVAARYLLRQR